VEQESALRSIAPRRPHANLWRVSGRAAMSDGVRRTGQAQMTARELEKVEGLPRRPDDLDDDATGEFVDDPATVPADQRPKSRSSSTTSWGWNSVIGLVKRGAELGGPF
jgi:hypothetical protein